jgi:hypothetical protein
MVSQLKAILKKLVFFLLLFEVHFGLNAQECGYIYVSPTGASSGNAGTKANPASLDYGLTLAAGSVKHLRLAQGTYPVSNTIDIPNNVIIEGGFDGTTWQKSNFYITSINRDSTNALSNPSRLIVFNGISKTGFRFQDLTINVADAGGYGTSIYAFYLSDCSDYLISRCIINTGKGSDGLPGLPGVDGADGADGQPGETGDGTSSLSTYTTGNGTCCNLGGLGAAPSYPGSFGGGNGGDGGLRGGFDVDTQVVLGQTLYYSIPNTNFAFPGNPGQGGAGPLSGNGGAGGQEVCQLTFVNGNCMATTSNRGGMGMDGFDGIPGNPGAQGTASFSGGFYFPGDGAQGNPGQSDGGAGGGGGGGGGKGCEPAAVNPLTGDTVFFTSGTGGGGGGGGEGGQRGQGGIGGTGGGASFCIFIYNNGLNGIIQDCVYNPGLGGQGGLGGPGGQGGQGGQGGKGGVVGDNGPNNSCNNGEGGKGGFGGNGGIGGPGGKGSDGMSAGLYETPGGMPVLRPYSYNPFAPQVNVEYFGCTNSSVIASTNATGQIAWLFGFGAVPQTISGNNVTIEYSNPLGYRNITLVVDGVPYFFANFINLETSFTKPIIDASRKTICTGQSTTLGTTASAQSYNWLIPGSSLPNSLSQNPGEVSYDAPGLYPVTLEITTCCGISKVIDTIRVLSVVQPNLGEDTSICYLEPLPDFQATGYAGATYTWTSNGGSFGADTNIVEAGGPGEYTVTIDYGSGCAGKDTIQFDVYTTLPLGLEDTTICLNSPFPLLDANYFGGNYIWTLDGNPIGTNSRTFQSTIPGSYAVTVTAPSGCQGSDSIRVAISDPRVNLGFDVTICSNEPMPVLNAQNIGSDYQWTYNGNATGGNTQTLFTSMQGQYGVTITNQYGCQASDAMILTLTPSITTGINGPSTVSVGVPASFQDATVPGATSWIWSFGDGTPLVTTSAAPHTYTEGGQFPVFLISGNGICSDTASTVVNVLWNCSTLGLTAELGASTDTIFLSELGTVVLSGSGTNAETYEWDFGDGNFSNEDTLVYAYASPGVYTITLTTYNYNCSTSVTQTIIVEEDKVGMEEQFADGSKILLFPNPFQAKLNMDFEKLPKNLINIELENSMGQRVYSTQLKPEYIISLPLPNFSAGLYYLSLKLDEKTVRFKVIKE